MTAKAARGSADVRPDRNQDLGEPRVVRDDLDGRGERPASERRGDEADVDPEGVARPARGQLRLYGGLRARDRRDAERAFAPFDEERLGEAPGCGTRGDRSEVDLL